MPYITTMTTGQSYNDTSSSQINRGIRMVIYPFLTNIQCEHQYQYNEVMVYINMTWIL